MGRDTVIENPILNSPFEEPGRHFRFDEEGITNEVVEERRGSSYFVPIAGAKRRGAQQAFDTEWTADRVAENANINRIRERVALWRRGGHVQVTPTTRRLLEYWIDDERERRLFFCQIEALETAIYIAEVAPKVGDAWIQNELTDESQRANPGLLRVAHKMATGSGKTVVMGMLIAWHTLNKAANPRDRRFADRCLVVAPGITIRDRLRVLLPSDPDNYYRERDLVPPELWEQMGRAQIVITNFHAFLPRLKTKVSKLHRELMHPEAVTETPDEMVRRVCRELGTSREIVVLNDEAHHCYRRRPEPEIEEPKLTGEARKEAKEREEEARVWVSGLEAVNDKLGIKTVYDLSATPFYLAGSGWPEGTLFQWVVSDFSLIDAIESGVVKVPRVPVADDSMATSQVVYRDLWLSIRDGLPKKGRKAADMAVEPRLPERLQAALHSLYGDYEKSYRRWQEAAAGSGSTPPVFIVVCNNTATSKLVHDYIAGWEAPGPDDTTVVRTGALDLFSNAADGAWIDRPNTILIDSSQLESGEAMSAEFKKMAAGEIDEFKAELRERFPGRDVDDLTDEDLLREVMNTVGKPGRLGEHVRCVVSVSMLTEGWDANTVSHILGVRAFSTQLVCEQVVGRGLRRRSYTLNDEGRFDPEYAEVYGVPFSFLPAAGSTTEKPRGPMPTRVRALEARMAAEITFPLLVGYRHEMRAERLSARFGPEHHLAISARDVPTKVAVEPIVGEANVHTLDDLRDLRPQTIAFQLARRLAQERFRDSDGTEEQPWLFPQLVTVVRRWMDECVKLGDGTFIQMLRLHRFEQDAIDKIHRAIASGGEGDLTVVPVLRPYDPVGSTRHVGFDTTRSVVITDPDRCHISHVVEESRWEGKMAQALEDMDEVVSYVKNQGLGFLIPYTIDGDQRSYLPDFIVRYDDGSDEPLHLIVEVSGEKRRDKDAKVQTAKELWIPAVNGHGGFGRWGFVEVTDPWDAQNTIRGVLRSATDATISA